MAAKWRLTVRDRNRLFGRGPTVTRAIMTACARVLPATALARATAVQRIAHLLSSTAPIWWSSFTAPQFRQSTDEFEGDMNAAWSKALARLKALCGGRRTR